MSEQNQEMYDEINTMLVSLARAFKLKGEGVAKAIETGDMQLKLGVDTDGRRYVEATFKDQTALVYPGDAQIDMDADHSDAEKI